MNMQQMLMQAQKMQRELKKAQDELKAKEGYIPDIVVLLQPTTPLRDAKQLDEAFDIFLNNDCDSVFAAQPIGITHGRWRQNPQTHELECLYDYRHRPRRQERHLHYPLFKETVAPVVLVSVRSFRIRTTPVVPFFTVISGYLLISSLLFISCLPS